MQKIWGQNVPSSRRYSSAKSATSRFWLNPLKILKEFSLKSLSTGSSLVCLHCIQISFVRVVPQWCCQIILRSNTEFWKQPIFASPKSWSNAELRKKIFGGGGITQPNPDSFFKIRCLRYVTIHPDTWKCWERPKTTFNQHFKITPFPHFRVFLYNHCFPRCSNQLILDF